MKDKLEDYIHPRTRFLMGVSLIFPWTFLDDVVLKLAGFFILAGLTLLSGKKLKWSYFILLTASISLFHLLTPSGLIIAKIGNIPITWGSLEQGIRKALTLIGLVFISLSTVKPGLKLPGALGRMLGTTLLYYQELLVYRKHLKPASLIPDLDNILIGLDKGEQRSSASRTKPLGWMIFLVVFALITSLCLWSRIG